jgi:benzoyl-CoA reductase/2-hydroxyglutaryl-CoA dehydratase subunit BcrC/BadD/HgdB
MSKQFETLEAALDLPSLSEIKNDELDAIQLDETDDEISGEVPTMEDVKEALARANSLEQEMEKLDGYDQHDREMDELAGLAIQAHKDLQDLGMNVEIRHAGEIFSS